MTRYRLAIRLTRSVDRGETPEMKSISRRGFLTTSATLPLGGLGAFQVSAENAGRSKLSGRFYKSLKIGMISEGATLADKFAAAKEAGFDGVELNAPGFDVVEVNAAVEANGIPVDGSVCAGHWGVRHSDPDDSVRAKALETLLSALQATHDVGGHTVLLVVGHGKDGTEDEVWERSVSNIRMALPLAARLGVSIAIENVWNQFCYVHDGSADQSAEKFVRYVDEFESPFVGMQFDIGNHWKYGNTGDWIRELGTRIHKLDVKGFSRASDRFTGIGEGDLDFPDVVAALEEINFHGWCAAEVGGGNLERLKEISQRMDRVFRL